MSSTNSDCGCGPCGNQPVVVDASKEPLTSVIDNFVLQFFGTVTKEVVNGEIVWVLPCDLDTGVPENPRLPDEGLACYFKRLFLAGVVGMQGPAGAAGTNGAAGINAFTTVKTLFASPTLSNPDVTFAVQDASGIAVGSIYFVATLGWLQVFATATQSVSATLLQTVDSPAVSVLVGALVTPSGPRGPSGLNGYTTTSSNFTPPAIAGSINIPLRSVASFATGLWVFIETSGYYQITSVSTNSVVAVFKQAVSVPASPVLAGAKAVPTAPIP